MDDKCVVNQHKTGEKGLLGRKIGFSLAASQVVSMLCSLKASCHVAFHHTLRWHYPS